VVELVVSHELEQLWTPFSMDFLSLWLLFSPSLLQIQPHIQNLASAHEIALFCPLHFIIYAIHQIFVMKRFDWEKIGF
jgi:hypothetical protein